MTYVVSNLKYSKKKKKTQDERKVIMPLINKKASPLHAYAFLRPSIHHAGSLWKAKWVCGTCTNVLATAGAQMAFSKKVSM